MSSFGYHQGIEDIYKGNIDLLSDDIRCGLLADTYVPDQVNDQFFSDVSADEVSGAGYFGAVLLQNKTFITTSETTGFDADNILDWEDASFIDAQYILIYKDTGNDATSPLIALIDFGGNRNAPMTITWNDGGIFGFNSSNGRFDVNEFEDETDPLTEWTYFANDWDEQTDPSVVPLTSDTFDTITGAWDKYNDCETVASPFGFDSVVDVGGDLTITQAAKKENTRGLNVRFDDGVIAYGILNAGAVNQTQGVIALWVNFDYVTLEDGKLINFCNAHNGVTTSIWILQVRNNSGTFQVRAQHRVDAGTVSSSSWVDISSGWVHIIHMFRHSSGIGADDGWQRVFIEGELEIDVSGIDNDTLDWDLARFGKIFTDSTVFGGAFYMDELYVDPDGAPFTVAIQQMQGRDYSMCLPANSVAIHAGHTFAGTTEMWVEFDWKNATNSFATLNSIGRLRDGVLGFNAWRVQYDQSAQEMRLLYQNDAGATLVGIAFFDVSAFDDFTIAVYWRASSAPAADDGEIQFYLDGELQGTVTGIDNDTFAADRTQFGYTTATDGVSFYGTARCATNTVAIAVKDWAAEDGNFGVCQYISPSAALTRLHKDFPLTAIFTCDFDINANNITMANGDEFICARLYRTVTVDDSFKVSLKNNAGSLELLVDYWDGAAFQSVTTYTFPADKKARLRVVYSEETALAAGDGWIIVYIDGVVDGFATDINTPQTNTDRFEITTKQADAGTSGTVFYDNVNIATETTPYNPLDAGLDNPASLAGDFEDIVVPNLEDLYFVVFFLDLIFVAPTIDSRPFVQVPSVSEYKVRLKDQDGDLVAEFDNWLSLNFNHRQNVTDSLRFEIDGRDTRTSLFELDGQIEVWRRNESVELDWYIEWEGFFRTPNDLVTASDDERFVAHGISYLNLLKRAFVQWAVGSSQATKSDFGETVIKEIAQENIGAGALASAGRQRDHAFPGLSIEADGARGLSWDGAFADKQCSSIIRQIAEATGLVVDIVGVGDALFELQVYEGQRGEDRSSTSADPLIFSTGFGNMETPLLSINRGDEITAVTAMGQGVETDKRKRTKTSSAITDSPWNDIEGIVSASQATTDDELDSSADAQLQIKKKIEALSFNVLQTKSSFYGKDYTWGTKATAIFKDFEEDIVIDNVNITINGQEGNENITIRFSNENLVQ